jgi:hypothetical protein
MALRKGILATASEIFPVGKVSLRDDSNYKMEFCMFAELHFYINIFEENISQAKPVSHAARRISQICKANLFHCGLGISLCPTH